MEKPSGFFHEMEFLKACLYKCTTSRARKKTINLKKMQKTNKGEKKQNGSMQAAFYLCTFHLISRAVMSIPGPLQNQFIKTWIFSIRSHGTRQKAPYLLCILDWQGFFCAKLVFSSIFHSFPCTMNLLHASWHINDEKHTVLISSSSSTEACLKPIYCWDAHINVLSCLPQQTERSYFKLVEDTKNIESPSFVF